jgi:hypothetical protein
VSEIQVNEEKLRSTTDVTVWAEEFCKFFDGWTVIQQGDDRTETVNEGTMIGWFANYAQTCNDFMQSKKEVHPGVAYAFEYFFHLDCSNAAMHQGTVRYSPITFRLAEHLHHEYPVAIHFDPVKYHDVHLVLADKGAYAEDPGR